MSENEFEVKGKIRIDRVWHPYSKVVTASNENMAVERFYTIVGSKHHLDRNAIRIESVKKSGRAG